MPQKKIAVFDCETDPFLFGRKPEPFLIGYWDEKQYRSFRRIEEFVEFVKTQDVICYAHNGGKFDFLYLLPYFEPDTKVFLINERLASFKLGLCEFRDSYLILPMPLSAYKKDEIDYSIFERGYREDPDNLRRISDYLENDCRYLFELVKAFRLKYGGGMTLASTAMKQWQKISGRKSPSQREAQFVFFKQWYFGGRVEVFEPGVHDLPIKVWDINSAYPKAMTAKHPYGTVARKLDKLPTEPEVIGRCFLEIETNSMGAFPFQDKDGLKFPADGLVRNFKVTGWEYLAARDTGTLGPAKILTIYLFDDVIDFQGYVSHFYDLKKASDPASPDYVFAKLFLNSLYGKFGQDCRDFKEFYLVEQKKTMEKEVEMEAKFQDFVSDWSLLAKPISEERKKFYNVAVAASITGYVRAFLWRSICSATKPFYCDTDCIHALAFDGKVGPELGEWKLEFEATMGGYAGKKLYALFNETKTKSASKGARLTPNEVLRVAQGETIAYKQDAPSMSMRSGVKFIERDIRMTI